MGSSNQVNNDDKHITFYSPCDHCSYCTLYTMNKVQIKAHCYIILIPWLLGICRDVIGWPAMVFGIDSVNRKE